MLIRRLKFIVAVLSVVGLASMAAAQGIIQTNIVTDNQAAHPAKATDTNLVNCWGMSSSSAGPIWVSDNGTGKATIYAVSPGDDEVSKNSLVVSIPGAGNPTGQAFNGGSGFNSDLFLFVSEDGTVSGWRNALGTDAETFQAASTANVYKGVALADVGANTYLYAANFKAGTIDVLKGSAAAPNLSGTFTDPNLPSGYAPFNVQIIGDDLFVTYAIQDAAKHDDVAGVGNGIVNEFDTEGNFVKRFASNGDLNSPWGMAIAPSSFGDLAGMLLVGNFGDGKINAFNLTTGALIRQLQTPGNQTLVIDGLWALKTGNDADGGSLDRVYFTSGPDGETHGLFGSLATPEPATVLFVLVGLPMLIRRRARGL